MIRIQIVRWGKVFLAEAIGTSFLLIIGCLGCVNNYEKFNPSHITVSIGAGLALMIGINSFATISGAHINPVVTLAALVYEMINFIVSVFILISRNFNRLSCHLGCNYICSCSISRGNFRILCCEDIDSFGVYIKS